MESIIAMLTTKNTDTRNARLRNEGNIKKNLEKFKNKGELRNCIIGRV